MWWLISNVRFKAAHTFLLRLNRAIQVVFKPVNAASLQCMIKSNILVKRANFAVYLRLNRVKHGQRG